MVCPVTPPPSPKLGGQATALTAVAGGSCRTTAVPALYAHILLPFLLLCCASSLTVD